MSYTLLPNLLRQTGFRNFLRKNYAARAYSRFLEELAALVGLKEFERNEKSDEYFYSLWWGQPDTDMGETMFMIKGRVDRFIGLNGEVNIRSRQGDVLVTMSFLLNCPTWSIDTKVNEAESAEVFAAIKEFMLIFAELEKRLHF